MTVKVRVLAQYEKRPAGVGRQSYECIASLRSRPDLGLDVRVDNIRRGFRVHLLGREFLGYISIMLSRLAPMKRYDGEVVHAASPGLLPMWGDRVDIVTFYDVFPWVQLSIYQRRMRDAVRIASYVPRILSARVIVAPTRYVEQQFRAMFGDAVPVVLIPCGLDRRIWRQRPLKRLERTVLVVGADYPRKNLAQIVRACARVKAELRLVGEWRYPGAEAKVKSLASDLGVRLRDLGYLTDDRLVGEYSQASALVSASLDEGFGLTPLEAMACGTAAAVSDIPPHKEVLGPFAHYFDPHDPADIARAMEEAFNLDPDRRSAMIAHADRFDWPNVVGHYARLYHDVHEGRYA